MRFLLTILAIDSLTVLAHSGRSMAPQPGLRIELVPRPHSVARHLSAVVSVRGGELPDIAASDRLQEGLLHKFKTKCKETQGVISPILKDNDKVIGASFAAIVVVVLMYQKREMLKPLLDKAYIQEKALTILRDLESNPLSLPIYAGGMAIWELLGLSTIPVETAAGMVFGLKRGLLASGAGKLLGASAAFWLGRGLLAQYVHEKLKQNTIWSVLNRSTDVHPPLVVALLMKFSCFPEFVKNFGSSCLNMTYKTFLTATAIHGLMFSFLWTALGEDAAARLENASLAANVPLQVALVLAVMLGLVGSPLLMAWWIRDMKKLAVEK